MLPPTNLFPEPTITEGQTKPKKPRKQKEPKQVKEKETKSKPAAKPKVTKAKQETGGILVSYLLNEQIESELSPESVRRKIIDID